MALTKFDFTVQGLEQIAADELMHLIVGFVESAGLTMAGSFEVQDNPEDTKEQENHESQESQPIENRA